MRIVFATGNQNKLKEIREILGDLAEEVISMKDAGVDGDIDENGSTFAENALIKAGYVARKLQEKDQMKDTIVLADDSGLEVDAMDRQPGIYSARFMGHDTSYTEKNNAILAKLEGVPEAERTARFVCAIAAVVSSDLLVGKEQADGLGDRDLPWSEVSQGLQGCAVTRTMEGRIGYEIAGTNGFGYDPIFFLPEFGKTSAEITPEQKNQVSHRGKGLRAMEAVLKDIL